MYKIEQLTTEGSEFKSNNSGHVVDVNEVMSIVQIFLFLYIFRVFFILLFYLCCTENEVGHKKLLR